MVGTLAHVNISTIACLFRDYHDCGEVYYKLRCGIDCCKCFGVVPMPGMVLGSCSMVSILGSSVVWYVGSWCIWMPFLVGILWSSMRWCGMVGWVG